MNKALLSSFTNSLLSKQMVSSMGKEQGVSTFGFLYFIGTLAFLGTIAFRVAPFYIDDNFIKGVVMEFENDADLYSKSSSQIRRDFSARAIVNNVRDISANDLKIEREASKIIISLDYERRVNIFGNADAVLSFSHKAYVHAK